MASAATVRGSSPESTLSATPSARKPADGLDDLRPQLVGERDERDRLQRGQRRAAVGVAQPGGRVDGAGQQQHAQPLRGPLVDCAARAAGR